MHARGLGLNQEDAPQVTRSSVVALLLVVFVASCGRQEQAAADERLTADEKVRAILETDPSQLLAAAGWQVEQLPNNDTRATAISWTNRSNVAVADLQGQLTYMDDTGGVMATVPFTADGEIGPGETKMLKVSADAVAGTPTRSRVHVDTVRIVTGR